MAGFSSRSDRLWQFAVQLFEEGATSISSAQQEAHGQRIQSKFNQLVNNLSCVGDMTAAMYQEEKLTSKELEQIQSLQSTPIRANEELLRIIARKPRDVYECFLSLLIEKKSKAHQPHLYQMLVSDGKDLEDASEHRHLIRRNFIRLSERLDTDNGLISLLYQNDVLTARERDDINCTENTFKRNELLLGLLSKKSPQAFKIFLGALEDSGQCHLSDEITKLKDSLADPKGEHVNHDLLPTQLPKSEDKLGTVGLCPSSNPAPQPTPNTQPTSASTKSIDIEPTEAAVNFLRTKGFKFQARLNGLDNRLQKDFAIKVTFVSLFSLDKPDALTRWFRALLQDCCQMSKEIDLEQLRQEAHQCMDAAALNEALLTQLQSVQQELGSERMQNKKSQMQLEEKIEKLKADIYNEKMKYKRLKDEKLRNKSAITELEERLKKAESDKPHVEHQMQELRDRLISAEFAHQNTYEHLETCNTEMISLKIEIENLKKACKILEQENDSKKVLEAQLLQIQKYIDDLLPKLKERHVELTVEKKFEPTKHPKDAMEGNSLEGDRTLKLEAELRSEKHRRQELEDKLSHAIAQLDQLNSDLQARYATKDIYGLAVLGQDVFISRKECPDIEVYDLRTFDFMRRMEVSGMTKPEHIVSCIVNNCLYASDWIYREEFPAVLRIDPRNGSLITIWNINGSGGRLSVARNGNVILSMNHEAMIHEYTAHGETVRTYNFGADTRISQVWHAIKLNSGQFVICHSGPNSELESRVCLFPPKDTIDRQATIDEADILMAYGGEQEESFNVLMKPTYLSVDGEGSILVSDESKKQAVLLSSNLDKPRILVSEEDGIKLPWRTCFDGSTKQWLLADLHRFMVLRVKDATVEQKLYKLTSH